LNIIDVSVHRDLASLGVQLIVDIRCELKRECDIKSFEDDVSGNGT